MHHSYQIWKIRKIVEKKLYVEQLVLCGMLSSVRNFSMNKTNHNQLLQNDLKYKPSIVNAEYRDFRKANRLVPSHYKFTVNWISNDSVSRDSGIAHILELLGSMWTHTLIYIPSFLLDAIIIKSFIICSVRYDSENTM